MRRGLLVALLALAACGGNASAPVVTLESTVPGTIAESELYETFSGVLVPMPGDAQRSSTQLSDPDNAANVIDVNTLTVDLGKTAGVTVLFWQQQGTYDVSTGAENAGERLQAQTYVCAPKTWLTVPVVDCVGKVANGPVYTRTLVVNGLVIQVLVGAADETMAQDLFLSIVEHIEVPGINGQP